jgi:hypothetical protein
VYLFVLQVGVFLFFQFFSCARVVQDRLCQVDDGVF